MLNSSDPMVWLIAAIFILGVTLIALLVAGAHPDDTEDND